MRLIDASDLWSDIQMLPHNGDMISSEEVEQAIMDAPTVDAVPVVRCRECDHKTHDGNDRPYCLQLEMYLNKELDFFCKYGERRTGND